MKVPFDQLTAKQLKTLLSIGALHDLYPEDIKSICYSTPSSSDNHEMRSTALKIMKMIVAIYDEYDIIKVKAIANKWISVYEN
jgi:hypothetical protein